MPLENSDSTDIAYEDNSHAARVNALRAEALEEIRAGAASPVVETATTEGAEDIDVPEDLPPFRRLEEFERSQMFLEQPFRAIPGAINDIFDTAKDITESLDLPNPQIVFMNKEGSFIKPRLLSEEEAKREGVEPFRLPDLAADSPAKQAVQDISRFMIKFLALRGKGSGVAGDIAAAGAAGFTQPPEQEGLAEFVAQSDTLRPIVEPLLNDQNDSEVVKRTKNLLEEAGAGSLFESFVNLTKLGVGKLIGKGRQTVEQATLTITDEDLALLGDFSEEAPLFTKEATQTKEGFIELPRKGKKGNVFVNFARINAEDDVKDLLKSMTEDFAGEIKEAQRGKITQVETQKLAKQLGMSVQDVLNRRKGQAFNAEEALAARRIMVASTKKLLDLSDLAHGPDKSPKNMFLFNKMMGIHRDTS